MKIEEIRAFDFPNIYSLREPVVRLQVRLGYGKHQKVIKRDVVPTILDTFFPEGTPFTIPIVSITGTNGKTTTTRMISSILKHQGFTVGTTTSQGIYINDRRIESGDTTGPKSAKRILYNREVEAAVLETARGGIVRRGLAYLLHRGALSVGISNGHIEIIPDEEEALKKALKDAQDGDIIIIFFENMEPLVQIIKNYKIELCKESDKFLLC